LLLDTARSVSDGDVASEELEAPVRSTVQAVVRTATRYLRDNLARPIEVATSQPSTPFRKAPESPVSQGNGTTILEYLTNLRVETAGQLLLDRELSIKQVARAVGYPTPTTSTSSLAAHRHDPAVFRSKGGTRFNDEGKRPRPAKPALLWRRRLPGLSVFKPPRPMILLVSRERFGRI
jgi:methylphosphotriester-DNA--protein-cysteine methyltransferase